MMKINDRSLKTRWADEVEDHPLPEYPRPQMRREKWLNLNGHWDYAILGTNETGKMRVPFCIESHLSGVGRLLQPAETLRYTRKFAIPSDWKDSRIILHFGAVDWEAKVSINGKECGLHQGGYTPFSFDITDYLGDGENELQVDVRDSTDQEGHPFGKQKLKPEGIFYTPCSGIWQTVWLEPVRDGGIKSMRITPDLDANQVKFSFELYGNAERQIKLEAGDLEVSGSSAEELVLEISEPRLWSPDNPYLYELEIEVMDGEKEIDEVESYFAMRKFSKGKDKNGIMRLMLNNKPIIHVGPLDQGYWPDGIYTAPTDEALKYDIVKTKEMGFNMIRKHVKIEPARWYYHCDKLGMIVWQDMPNGGKEGWNALSWIKIIQTSTYKRDDTKDRNLKTTGMLDSKLRQMFRTELKEMIDYLYNAPSIGVWVPFNEGWGQFNADKIGKWLMEYDPTRQVDTTSGFNLKDTTDIRSWHIYIRKLKMVEKKVDPNWVLALSEIGGYTLNIEGHTWDAGGKITGYGKTADSDKLTEKYEKLMLNQALPLVEKGVSAFVYTQTTDVETEVNGFLTYDREVDKMDFKRVKITNEKLIESLKE